MFFIMFSSDFVFIVGMNGHADINANILSVRHIGLLKFSFDSLDSVSQWGLIHLVIAVYMWESIFVDIEAFGATQLTSHTKRSID